MADIYRGIGAVGRYLPYFLIFFSLLHISVIVSSLGTNIPHMREICHAKISMILSALRYVKVPSKDATSVEYDN